MSDRSLPYFYGSGYLSNGACSVGVSPRTPTITGRDNEGVVSPQIQKMNLRNRIRQHTNLNAEGSTLRLSLGVLLEEELGIQLRRVGSGTRKTFTHSGEAALSQWMAENAFVTWLPHEALWVVEEELIATLSLPLNLDQNRAHSFASVLSGMRSAAKRQAEALPVIYRSSDKESGRSFTGRFQTRYLKTVRPILPESLSERL